MGIPAFDVILRNLRGPDWKPPARLLALDPGETMGWTLFVDGQLAQFGQEALKNNPFGPTMSLIDRLQPTNIVMENYRVYGHKTEQHAWAELFTPQLIGAIKYHCEMKHIPVDLQMAQQAKGFCDDAKLKAWGFWKKGARHSRDAIRHACFWLLFHKEELK